MSNGEIRAAVVRAAADYRQRHPAFPEVLLADVVQIGNYLHAVVTPGPTPMLRSEYYDHLWVLGEELAEQLGIPLLLTPSLVDA